MEIFSWSRMMLDPSENGASGGGISDIVGDAFDEHQTDGTEGAAKEGEEGKEVKEGTEGAAKEGEEGAAKKWDGKDRRKGYTGEKRRADETDPEFEMDFEKEAGKGNVKYKLSNLKEIAKWIFDQSSSLKQHARLTGDMAKNPTFKNLMEGILKNVYKEDGAINEEYITSTMSKLEGKQDKLDAKQEEVDDEIKEMEEQLAELDADSPQGKITAKNIAILKRTKAALAARDKDIDAFKKRLEGLETKSTEKETKEAETVKEKRVAKAREMFNTEIAALTSPENKAGYRFRAGTKEDKFFDSEVRSLIGKASKEGKIKTDEDFIKVIRESAKAVYQEIVTQREAHLAEYLKTKPKGSGGAGKEVKEGDKKETTSLEDGAEGLANLLSEATEEVIK